MRCGIAAGIAALLLGLGGSPACADYLVGYMPVNGQTRSYLIYRPPTLAKLPALVVVLHGGFNATPRGMDTLTNNQFDRLADQTGALIVYPAGIDGQWADGRGVTKPDQAGIDDVAFLLALRAQMRHDYNTVDTFLTGISNGGFMAMRFACEAPTDTLQGVSAVVATRAVGLACPRTAALPFALFVGASDPLINYYGGDTAQLGKWMAVEALVAEWTARNGCSTLLSPSIISDALPDAAGTIDLARSWWFCSATTELHAIAGMGHTWPGGRQYAPVTGPLGVGLVSREVPDAAQAMWDVWH